jgi:hypothetical protein
LRKEVRLEVVREWALLDLEVGVFGFAVLALCVEVVLADEGAVSGNTRQARSRTPTSANARKRFELRRLIGLSVPLPASAPEGQKKSADYGTAKAMP